MLLTNPIDPETKRRRALARVYALLVRLAEDKQQPAQPIESKPTDSKNERTTTHEKQAS